MFETPLSDLLERTFDSDLVRGTVLTDGLIGTFASAHDPELRQNRCFLYHVIGGSWDVPVGGMGALSGALAGARAGPAPSSSPGPRWSGSPPTARAPRSRAPTGGNMRRAHVLAGVAPHVLSGLLGDPPGAGKPEGAQLKINMLLERLPRVAGRQP